MDLSVILLNYKTGGLVKQLLKNLFAKPLPLDYEVLVVDNNSRDGCLKMVQENFPSVITIQSSKNIGFGAGNNLALKKARGDFILFINPDVAIISEMIVKLFTFIKSRPEVGIVGPRLLNPDGSLQFSCFRFPTIFMPFYSRTILKKIPYVRKKLNRYRMVDFDHKETRPVDWIVGGCMMIRKQALDSYGFFDERYFMYFEDIDLCRTFWKNGVKVYYYPQAEMVHYHQRLSADEDFIKNFFNKTLYFHISSWIKYVRKYIGKKA